MKYQDYGKFDRRAHLVLLVAVVAVFVLAFATSGVRA